MTDVSAPPPWRAPLLVFAPFALLFLGLMGAGLLLTPDPVRGAPREREFDTHGALQRLARVLGDETPHPVDSDAQDAVRAALLAEIEALGFQPEIRDTFACRPQPRGPLVDCARVRNIVFGIGPPEAPAILAAAHYDSVPAAPGAGDDGVGIGVWLEIARLLSHEELARRVVFLFSDGEEPALLGAHAFAQSDPLAPSIEALVNLEARGTRGPAVFFESNQPNADAVAAYAVAPRGIANSVTADVYRLLSNSSDVTALTRPGLDVVNIALIDGFEDYHTPQDTLASLDPRSVQHMGDMALAVVRRLAGEPDRGVDANMVYADIASRAFVSMPSWAGQAALAFSALVAFAAFWRAGAEARWRTFAVPVLALLLAAALAFAIGFALGIARPGHEFGFAAPEPMRAWCVLVALFGIVAALMLTRASRNGAQTEAAALFWFSLLGFAGALALPGVSILYVLPALVYALGCLVAFAWKPAQTLGGVAAAVVALIVWGPMLFLTELALGFAYPFAAALLFAIVGLTWIGLFVRANGEGRWRSPALALSASALVAVIGAALAPNATEARPLPLNINYFLNTSTGEARVLAGTARRALPSAVARSFAFEPELILPGDRAETWAAPADAHRAPSPDLVGLVVTAEGGERVVRARIAMNGAYRLIVRIPRAAGPRRAVVNGAAADFAETGEDGDYMNLACQGRACDGAEMVVVLDPAAEASAEWHLIGQYPGASAPPAAAVIARRPASATPIQFGDGVVTLTPVRP